MEIISPTNMKTLFFASLVFISSNSLFAQGFTPPAEGKAVIYFARITGLGFAVNFEYFERDKYIGDFAGRGYFRYECEPGEHLFWVSTENREFLTATVKAGATYVVVVDVEMGAIVARVGLSPITQENEVFKRVKKLIDQKSPKVNTPAEIQQKNVKLKKFIADQLKKYEDDWKDTKDFKTLTEDMAIADSALKSD